VMGSSSVGGALEMCSWRRLGRNSMTGRHLASTRLSAQSRQRHRVDDTGGTGGHPPQTTLTRNPLSPLVRGHETQVAGFGNAQKIRVWGGCPPAPPSPSVDGLAAHGLARSFGGQSASGAGWGRGHSRSPRGCRPSDAQRALLKGAVSTQRLSRPALRVPSARAYPARKAWEETRAPAPKSRDAGPCPPCTQTYRAPSSLAASRKDDRRSDDRWLPA